MQLYGDDQQELRFTVTANGVFSTPMCVVGGEWSFTVHGVPPLAGIKVEANNSQYYQTGLAGNINPISFSIQSANSSPHATSTAVNPAFASNWVTVKPESEFIMTGGTGVVTHGTGVFQLQGVYRFVRLSMTAAGTGNLRAYYFDSGNILRG